MLLKNRLRLYKARIHQWGATHKAGIHICKNCIYWMQKGRPRYGLCNHFQDGWEDPDYPQGTPMCSEGQLDSPCERCKFWTFALRGSYCRKYEYAEAQCKALRNHLEET